MHHIVVTPFETGDVPMISGYELAPSWDLSQQELEAIRAALELHHIKKGTKLFVTSSGVPFEEARDSQGRWMKALDVSNVENTFSITVFCNQFEHRSWIEWSGDA